MATIVRREKRKRGLFGWLFLLIFLAFNALMLVWVVGYWVILTEIETANDAERAGAAIGGMIGTGALLFVWAAGAIITGVLAMVTRGRKVIIEETIA